MKGATYIALSLIIIVMLVVIAVFTANDALFMMDFPKDSVLVFRQDTHGGFHGDGNTYEEIQLTKAGTQAFIKRAEKTGNWKKLPMPEDISQTFYCSPLWLQTQVNDESVIQKGLYFVKGKKVNTSNELYDMAHIIIAVLDEKTSMLYIDMQDL